MIRESKAKAIKSAFLMAERLSQERRPPRPLMDTPEKVAEIATCQINIKEEDLGNPVIQSLLTDYECIPDPVGGYILRPLGWG